MNKYYKTTDTGLMSVDMAALAKDVVLFIAIPSYKECKSEFTQALTQLGEFLTANRIRHLIHFHLRDSVPDWARNMCVANFLQFPHATHFLFLDDDLFWPSPDFIVRYLALDVDVLGGNYPKKFLFWDKIHAAILAAPDFASLPKTDAIRLMQWAGVDMTARTKPDGKMHEKLVEATRLPGGFTLIKREVFERIIEARPDLKYDTGTGEPVDEFLYAFYKHTIKDGEWLGEDYNFSELCRSVGVTIWKDTETQIAHIGAYIYSGDPAK